MELNIFHLITTWFEKISSKIDALSEKEEVGPRYSSDKIDQLGIALAKAQSEMQSAVYNKVNPYYKSNYADLKAVVESARPSLTKYGLSVVQVLFDDDKTGSWLETKLIHGESDQWIRSLKRVVPAKNDIQTISSHITYLKRMCYAALIGVVTGEEDDDGEVAVIPSRETFAKGVALNTKYNPKENTAEVITKEQLEALDYELAEYPDICEMVLDTLKIQSLADMPKAKFLAAITRIREIKNLRNGKKTK